MARPSTAARRYAEAAFELAERDGAFDGWLEGLQLAASVLADERVTAVVDNPAIPAASRLEVVDALIGKRVPEHVRNLARLLVNRGRVEILPGVAAEFKRLLDRRRGVVTAIVTSAAPLTADETEAVRDKLAAMTGREVEITLQVDEALIGGLTVRVGDQLLDASVRGRLERLRNQLVMGVRPSH